MKDSKSKIGHNNKKLLLNKPVAIIVSTILYLIKSE